LTIRQLLRLNHLAYTISWIRTKVEILDNTQQPDTVEPDHIHLGSPMDVKTVVEFADGSNGLIYATFRKMLETFLNQFYAAHELPYEEYLKVQGGQEVAYITLWLGTNN